LPGHGLVENDLLIRLHRGMLRVRMVEEGIVERYPEQEMRCPVHLCIGQEAVEVGACAALERRDQVFSGHRSHGHYLAKGGDLKAMLAEVYGKSSGCTGGIGGSMHLVDLDAGFMGAVPIVGSTIPIAVGAAFANKQREEDKVVMVFLGDGACETGVFHESINFAVLHDLPVIFLVENNLYSVYSPMAVRQPANRNITELAAGHGIAVDRGDGNDAPGVYERTKTAVDNARNGKGPSLLEFSTYRWRQHCGPDFDNDIGYRSNEEYLAWRERDPLGRSETFLIENNVLDMNDFQAMRNEMQVEIDAAFSFAKGSPFPSPDHASLHVYADDHQGR